MIRRFNVFALCVLFVLGAVPVSLAQETVPSGIPQRAFQALLKAKQWRQDAILVMARVNDYGGTGKFTTQFSFYSPSDRTGFWVIETAPGSSTVSQAGTANWGTQAIPSLFLDLPAAIQKARAQGMQGKMDHALLRVTSSGLSWEIAPAFDSNLRTYAINATLGAASPIKPEPGSDWLVVPGQRIGLLSLGMTPDEALKAVGIKSENCHTLLVNGNDGGTSYCDFKQRGITINFQGDIGSQASDRKAVWIGAEAQDGDASRKYSTDRGIRVGSSDQDVLKAYGNVERKQGAFEDVDLTYPKLGITFTLGGFGSNSEKLPKNVVEKIAVTQPRP